MGTTTLVNKNSGDTILAGFWNDIHTALEGDFVGRDGTGAPALNQNLGTAAIPWGTIRAGSLVIGGSTVDTTKIASPQNRIISGAKRSTSNQPLFLVPAGNAASATVKGLTTNLVVDINGSTITCNTDIVKSSLTLAPSTNNTCTVNDTAAAGQSDSRNWGEYLATKKITVSSMGSAITALVGKFATFKVVDGGSTEYFTAFVESTTVLSHAYRGYFFDSSSNPIKRVVLNNGDTITLMQQGFLFLTNDGVTLDVTYNVPTWAGSAPGSPATGDYWYDTVNQTWKRYDGSSFQIINRTLIGMLVMDATNCVAARSFDFYAAYSPNNTIDIEIGSTATNAQATRQFQRVNVAGKEIQFGNTLPTWTGANNYAGATDSYTTFSASSLYFLYVKDDGTQIVSDEAPHYRPDLFGSYHPHNPWRCVGTATTDGSSNWLYVGRTKKSVPEAKPPTRTILTSTGTTTGYLFTCTSANATIGATYTNNTQTFTVLGTIASGTQLFCSSTGAPAASGTLTKAGGTGDATITFSAAQAMATYTPPADALYLKVRQVGGGGGGGGSGTGAGAGGTGTITALGANILICNGGVGGTVSGNDGATGGTASIGTGASGLALQGGGTAPGMSTAGLGGTAGGSSPFGGAGFSTSNADPGQNAIANSGSGGGGSGTSSNANNGTGGGAGGYIDALITTIQATFPYCIGAGGAGGTAGTSGHVGGNGGSGVIIIEECYQ